MTYRTAAHETIAKSFTGRFWGYIPDADVKRRQKDAGLLLRASSNPPQATLESYEAPIMDQGPVSSCTGHGTAQGVYTSMLASGLSAASQFVPSPRVLYALARTLERQSNTQALTDSGAMPSDLLTVLRQYGIQPIAAPTSDGRYSDVEPANVNAEVSLLDLEISGLKLLTGEYRVDETAGSAVAQIQAAIASKIACGIGIFVDTGFMQWNPASGPIASIDLGDPQGGGHWLALTSYYTLPSGVVVLRGPNSWGAGWGSAGHYEITASALQSALSDCLIFKTSVVA